MKLEFNTPSVEVFVFEADDIINTSGEGANHEGANHDWYRPNPGSDVFWED